MEIYLLFVAFLLLIGLMVAIRSRRIKNEDQNQQSDGNVHPQQHDASYDPMGAAWEQWESEERIPESSEALREGVLGVNIQEAASMSVSIPIEKPVRKKTAQKPPVAQPLYMSQNELVRGIILSEVLGKPKALRPGGRR